MEAGVCALRRFCSSARQLLICEKGATSIEYALVASIISMAVMLGAISIGRTLQNTFETVGSNLE